MTQVGRIPNPPSTRLEAPIGPSNKPDGLSKAIHRNDGKLKAGKKPGKLAVAGEGRGAKARPKAKPPSPTLAERFRLALSAERRTEASVRSLTGPLLKELEKDDVAHYFNRNSEREKACDEIKSTLKELDTNSDAGQVSVAAKQIKSAIASYRMDVEKHRAVFSEAREARVASGGETWKSIQEENDDKEIKGLVAREKKLDQLIKKLDGLEADQRAARASAG